MKMKKLSYLRVVNFLDKLNFLLLRIALFVGIIFILDFMLSFSKN